MESFKIHELSFTYPGHKENALDGLSFSVNQGEFVTLAGPSGSGKSTLLRQLKTTLAPHGTLSGDILFEGTPLSEIDQRDQSARIGFVMQNPDNQIVTDKVWHELAFGLESLGCDTQTIRGRVAEISSFFGIQNWFYSNVSELSGGQKQLLSLASIMSMQPSVLILDEPTSQLDPIAASDFLAAVGKINRELGTTVIITEHRLEEVFPMSDRVIVMDEGKIICDGAPAEVGEQLKKLKHRMFASMPSPMRIYAAVESQQSCPITVRDGRLWLGEYAESHPLAEIPEDTKLTSPEGNPVIELDDVWFRFEKDSADILRGLSMKVYKGEFLAILGGNGAGKTTALSVISGINKPYRGKVLLEGKELSHQKDMFRGLLGVLPQNPQALFVKKTVAEDLYEIIKSESISKEAMNKKVAYVSRLCKLDGLLDRHPYDLSGGEQQRAALAKVLLLEPRILLLDEPTKGLDSDFKQLFAEILQSLLKKGVAIVMVSHDIEFCASFSHRCAMFFDGAIVTEDRPRGFFSGNSFYTTSANRMARHLLEKAITTEDVIISCGGTPPPTPSLPDDDDDNYFTSFHPQKNEEVVKLPLWRKIIAYIAGAIFIAGVAATIFDASTKTLLGNHPMVFNIVLIFSLLVVALSVSAGGKQDIANEQVSLGERKLPKRTLLATAMLVLIVPLTIFIGYYYLEDRKYFFISLLIIFESMFPFFLIFEGRKPQARELVVIAVLCAIGVAGRGAFYMLPQFKPLNALVIISGVAFGGEVGFLVGAITMLVSNFMFAQGPWTPWQMFAMGFLGFLAGLLFKKGLLRRNRLSLCVFGGLASIVIYGGIVNPSLVLAYNSKPTWQLILTAYVTGFPFDLISGLSTAFFLWVFSTPFLEKLDRIKIKYGFVEALSSELKSPLP